MRRLVLAAAVALGLAAPASAQDGPVMGAGDVTYSADLVFRILVQEASNRLRQRIVDAISPATDAEVVREIRRHGERRDYFLISRASRAGVLRARAEGRTGILRRDAWTAACDAYRDRRT